MKKIFSFLALGVASAAFATPTLTIDSVRQRWPFSSKVDVTFTVSGADGELYTLKDLSASDGDRKIPLDDLVFENAAAAYGEGTHRLVFDPAMSSLTNTVAIQHFRVSFGLNENPVRYLVLDLTKRAGEQGAVEYVCAGDPRLETFTQTIDYLDTDGVTPRQTAISYDDVWMSITNKTFSSGGDKASPYAIDKMAFRLVKPGDYVVGKGDGSAYNDVKLTKPYFISVFILSQGQYGQMRYDDWAQRDGSRNANAKDQSKQQAVYLDDLRGPHGDPTYPVDWIQYGHDVCPTSFIGQIRAKYGLAFDQPTETQWEVACRAGTRGYYYVNDSSVTAQNNDLLGKIGYVGGDSNPIPGERLANAWGLYDMLGRGQSVLDNASSTDASKVNNWTWPSGTDPVGAYSTWVGKTISKGGGHHGGAVVSCGLRGGLSNAAYANWMSPYYNGIRLVINMD